MDDLAKRHSNVEYLDTATMLDQYNDRAFIDTNHLTANGHTRVARAIDAELRRLGVLEDCTRTGATERRRSTPAPSAAANTRTMGRIHQGRVAFSAPFRSDCSAMTTQ